MASVARDQVAESLFDMRLVLRSTGASDKTSLSSMSTSL